MLNKNFLALLALLTAVFIFSSAAAAQTEETMAASSSDLVGVSLPANAQRVLPESVPAEINQTVDKLFASSEGKLRRGETEVLVWTGANYKKANATTIVNRLTGTLKTAGWQYEVSGAENGVTVFSLLKDGAKRRGLLGFYGATDDALIFVWTEVLAGRNNAATNEKDSIETTIKSARNGSANNIIGTWRTGGMSTMADVNTVTGATTPSNGSTIKYVFTADGRFENVGLIQSTMYGCTTSLFNDKRGKYELNGSTLTLIPSKNYWKQQNSCAPSSNKERDYTLDRETLEVRTKTDEYGKLFICLTSAKGESCYRQEKE